MASPKFQLDPIEVRQFQKSRIREWILANPHFEERQKSVYVGLLAEYGLKAFMVYDGVWSMVETMRDYHYWSFEGDDSKARNRAIIETAKSYLDVAVDAGLLFAFPFDGHRKRRAEGASVPDPIPYVIFNLR